MAAFLLIAPAGSAQQGGLYVALGDSIAAGLGASSLAKSYVQLYYGYLQSSGSGVTEILNPSRPGATSRDLRNQQLGSAVAVINQASDTKAVTINIGLNDLLRTSNCPTANAPTCPFAANLRAILREAERERQKAAAARRRREGRLLRLRSRARSQPLHQHRAGSKANRGFCRSSTPQAKRS